MGLIGDHEIDLDGRIGLKSSFFPELGLRAFVEKFQQNGITDPEPDGREIRRSITQISKEAVIATAPGNGSQAGLKRESLKDDSRIVGESTHHPEIRADIIAQTPGF